MSGTKYDQGKLRWDLLDLNVIEGIVKVLTFGAEKYAPNNWRGFKDEGRERVFAALLRHLTRHQEGERYDQETGFSHLDHAACNLFFLRWIEMQEEAKGEAHKGSG